MMVHLIDGTYELFRHFYGLRRFNKGKDRPYGAVVGVLQMIETGDRYIGVATDHVIESFRNRLWAGYKTGAGIERALLKQFHPLEEALAAMGVVVWPMIELEADEALASASHIASEDASTVSKSGASVRSVARFVLRKLRLPPKLWRDRSAGLESALEAAANSRLASGGLIDYPPDEHVD